MTGQNLLLISPYEEHSPHSIDDQRCASLRVTQAPLLNFSSIFIGRGVQVLRIERMHSLLGALLLDSYAVKAVVHPL